MKLTEIAVHFANKSMSVEDLKTAVKNVPKVETNHEFSVTHYGESWLDGDSDNTLIGVQALVPETISMEDYNHFVKFYVAVMK